MLRSAGSTRNLWPHPLAQRGKPKGPTRHRDRATDQSLECRGEPNEIEIFPPAGRALHPEFLTEPGSVFYPVSEEKCGKRRSQSGLG